MISGTSSRIAALRYTSVTHSRAYNNDNYANGANNPFGTPTFDSELMSVYATYSTGAPLPPPPAPVNTALPVISGTAQSGQTLSTSTGSWQNSPTGYTYQWARCNPTCATSVARPRELQGHRHRRRHQASGHVTASNARRLDARHLRQTATIQAAATGSRTFGTTSIGASRGPDDGGSQTCQPLSAAHLSQRHQAHRLPAADWASGSQCSWASSTRTATAPRAPSSGRLASSPSSRPSRRLVRPNLPDPGQPSGRQLLDRDDLRDDLPHRRASATQASQTAAPTTRRMSRRSDQSLRHAHVRQRAHVCLRHLQSVVGGGRRAASPPARRRRTLRSARPGCAPEPERPTGRSTSSTSSPTGRSPSMTSTTASRSFGDCPSRGLSASAASRPARGTRSSMSATAETAAMPETARSPPTTCAETSFSGSAATGPASTASRWPRTAARSNADGGAVVGNEWLVIDARTGDRTATIHGGRGPHNTVVSLDGAFAYLGGRTDRYLYVARTRDNRIVRRVGPLKPAVRPFTINGRGTLAFTTASAFLGFQMSDLTTGKVLYTVGVPGFRVAPSFSLSTPSHGISLSPDEREVYLVDAANGFVHVFDVHRGGRSSSEARREHQAAASVYRQRVAVQQRLRKGRLASARSQRSVRVRGRLGRRDRHAITRGSSRFSPRFARRERCSRSTGAADGSSRRPRAPASA